MTFVGKIFVVVQLVLTICFMAWAGAVYTAETNWREKAQSLTDQKAQAQAELAKANQALQEQETAATTEINKLKEQVALLDGQSKTASEQLARVQKELEDARAAVDRQTALATIAQEQADFRKEETLRQRDRNERLQTQINELLAQVRGLEDTIFAKDNSIANMQTRHEDVLADLSTYRKILLSQGMSLNPEDYNELGGVGEPPPAVVGQVLDTQVSQATGTEFVAVSLGSDDGFKKGHELTVYREGDYLGKIKLTSVDADKSVGHLIPSSRPRNGTIQKGDNVRP